MTRKDKIPSVKVEFERDNKVIIRVPYDHKCSKTTESYTHVSTKSLSAIKNLLNSLLAGGET